MDMFKSREMVDQFYKHPFVQSLYTKTMLGAVHKPTNIPNDIFAKAVVDVFLNAGKAGIEMPAGTMSASQMKQHLNESMVYLEGNNQPLARTMKYLVPKAEEGVAEPEEETKKLEANLAAFRSNAQAWFDTTMSEASITYRKNAQLIALVIGFVLAWLLNVDSIYITNQLWRDPTTRQAIVAQAGNINPNDQDSYDSTVAKLNQLSLPVGWNAGAMPQNSAGWLFKVFGFFITGTAAAQGAPFWFDILGKLSGAKKSQAAQK